MTTIAAGNHQQIYFDHLDDIVITPGSGGTVKFDCSTPNSAATRPTARTIYSAATISIPAGSTVFLDAVGADATYTTDAGTISYSTDEDGTNALDTTSKAALGASGFGGAMSLAMTKVTLSAFDSTPYQTYASLITLLDSMFTTAKGVTKTDRGLSSDGVNRVYEYRAGNGPINILVTCGVHGPELAGTWSMIRWLGEFVNPTSAVFAALRNQITVSWIPHANPSAFRGGRKNANLVDLNRNYPFYHSRYLASHGSTSDDNYPGASALSEPETLAIKAVIDARDIDGVIDCHNYEVGYSAYEILTGTGSFWTRSNRKHWRLANQVHKAVYSSNASTFGSNETDTNPTLQNWATHYLQNVRLKPHGNCALLECSRDIDGGDVLGAMTSGGVTKYAGYITTWIVSFLQTLYYQAPAPIYSWNVRRFNESSATSITAGGTLVDTAADTPMTWDQADTGIPGLPKNYIECPVTCKGWLDVTVEGTIENLSAAIGRYSIGIILDGGAVTNVTTESVTTSALNGERTNFTCSARFEITTVDATYVPKIQATINKLTGASHNLKRSRMTVRFTPRDTEVNNYTPFF